MARGGRRRYDEVDGILLLDKPPGMTSNRALQAVRRLLNAKKAGHTGSLDPLATGMLPICLGEATKISAFLLDSDKRYRLQCQLGVTTATGDAEGEVLGDRAPEHDALAQAQELPLVEERQPVAVVAGQVGLPAAGLLAEHDAGAGAGDPVFALASMTTAPTWAAAAPRCSGNTPGRTCFTTAPTALDQGESKSASLA